MIIELKDIRSKKIELHNTELGLWVSISMDELARAQSFCIRDFPNETGGVMLGRVTKCRTHAILFEFQDSPVDSKKMKFDFVRGIQGLAYIFSLAFTKKSKYMGDWHFHPGASPTPSKQDIVQLQKISQDSSYSNQVPIGVILGGRNADLVSVFLQLEGKPYFFDCPCR